jgi:hypothetical protein
MLEEDKGHYGTPPFKNKPPHCPILNQKEPRVKFKKHIIVYSMAMNKNKTFCGLWNIENMVQLKITILGMNSSCTNMTNVHTCTIRHVDLLTAVVLLSKGKLL